MKVLAVSALLAGSAAAAFAPTTQGNNNKAAAAVKAFTIDSIPGALPPVGIFDPLGLADKANEQVLKTYREAELTHGRVAMLASVGFLVGEAVQGKTVLFNGEVTGPAINHIPQVNPIFWLILGVGIANAELRRADIGWVEPSNVRFDQPGKLRDSYIPGDLGFDPLGFKPTDPEEFLAMQNKELQNGRVAMLAAAGFMAQELVDGKGIIEHLTSSA